MLKRVLFILLALLVSPTVSAAGFEELRILTSARITPPGLVERFERENNVRLRFEYFESPEAMAAYLQTRPKGDLALLRGHYVQALIESGQVSRLKPDLLPNLENLSPRARSAAFDPEGAFSVPYIRGLIGIIFRRDLLGAEKPVWHHVFGSDTGSIPFALTNQYRDTLGTALIYLGFSYNSTSPVAIGQAAELLSKLAGHPAFLGFLDQEETRRYLRENFIYVAVTYNNLAAAAMSENPDLDFAVPPDGGVAWSYVYVLNSASTKVEMAHKWLNYLMEPGVAAEISTWNRATSPNLAARPLMPPEIRDNPVLYPPESVWDEAETPQNVGPEAEQLFIEHWSHLK
jgi:Spermidine/putrescine-binding periplasmic protein